MSVPAAFFAVMRPHLLVSRPVAKVGWPFRTVARYDCETGRSRYSKDLIRAHPQLILQGDERRRRQADFERACRRLADEAQDEEGLAVDDGGLHLNILRPKFGDFHFRLSLPDNRKPVSKRVGQCK